MNRLSPGGILGAFPALGACTRWSAGATLIAFAAAAATHNDPLSAVQVLREGGCGGILPAAPILQPNPLLDRAAQQWAAGRTLGEATEHSGYSAESASGLHTTGPGSASVQPPALAARALELVNAARARGARCGERSFSPAPPVTLSDTLGGVALGH